LSHRTAIGLILLSGVLIGSATLGYPRNHDTSAFLVIAQTIVDGGVPYRDSWDIKGPGVFFFHALCLLIFGSSDLSLRVFDAVWQILTALVIGQIASHLYRSERARVIAAVGYLALYFSQSSPGWTQSDGPLNLFLAAGFYYFLKALEGDAWRDWTLAGAGVGVAILFKLPFGLAGVLMLLIALWRGGFDWIRAARRLSGLAIGATLPVGICLYYLGVNGALEDYLQAQFSYAPQYAQICRSTFALECGLARVFSYRLSGFYGLLALALAWRLWGQRAGDKEFLHQMVMWSWLGIALFVVAMGGLFFLYHFYPAFPAAAILGTGAIYRFGELWDLQRSWKRWLPALALLAVCVSSSLLILAHGRNTILLIRGGPPEDQWWHVASRYVESRTSTDDTIFVWGNYYATYVLANRTPATRFLGIFMFSPALEGLPYRERLLTDLRASRPMYIIQARGQTRNARCIYDIDEDGWLEGWPQLTAFFQEYVVEVDAPAYRILRRTT
jgi:hypothetical protein